MKATTSAEHEARRPQSLRSTRRQVANGTRRRTRSAAASGRRIRHRVRLLSVLLALLFGLGIALPDADAQSKRRKRRRRGRRGKATKVDRKPDKAKPADAPDAEGSVVDDDSPGDDGPGGDSGRDNARRDKDGVKAATRETKGAQVFDFTGLELGGQLRMPQLLYFLDRANEELQKASLEKRTFIPEMARSLDEERL